MPREQIKSRLQLRAQESPQSEAQPASRARPEGLLAPCPQPRRSLADLVLPENPFVVVGEHIEKPGNLGTMLRTADAADYSVGQEVTATTFEAGQKVDATGTTKGKGYAGVMKRHGFHGLRASHGVHRFTRPDPAALAGHYSERGRW